VQFGRQIRRQHTAVRAQAIQDQTLALVGEKSVEGVLSRSLHVVFCSLLLVVARYTALMSTK
jgi:H2-forming N5,N10-methylenetetrahydromethanopterin dehydrogenase-like enzyme